MQGFGAPSRVIATAFGLSAFSVAVVAGLAADNPAHITLGRALVSMIVCHVLGQFIGAGAENVVRRRIDAYKRAHPVPDVFSVQESETGQRHSAAAA